LEIGGTAEVETEWGGDDEVFEGGGIYECLIAEEKRKRTWWRDSGGGMLVRRSDDVPLERLGRMGS